MQPLKIIRLNIMMNNIASFHLDLIKVAFVSHKFDPVARANEMFSPKLTGMM